MNDKLVVKVDNIGTSDFLLKTKYNTDKTELENKIPDIRYWMLDLNLKNMFVINIMIY